MQAGAGSVPDRSGFKFSSHRNSLTALKIPA